MINDEWRTAPSWKLDLTHATTAQSILGDAMDQAVLEHDWMVKYVVVCMRDVVNMRKYCRDVFEPVENPDLIRQGIMGMINGAWVLVTPDLQPGDVRFVMDR
jgi:hypothetical protein